MNRKPYIHANEFNTLVQKKYSSIVMYISEYGKLNSNLSTHKINEERCVFIHKKNQLFIDIISNQPQINISYNISIKLFSGMFMNNFSVQDPFYPPRPILGGAYRVTNDCHCDQVSFTDYAIGKEDKTIITGIDLGEIASTFYNELISLPERNWE